MPRFTPCQGKTACRYDSRRCLTCGRELQEIDRLRSLLDQLATLAVKYNYENIEDYTGYVASKLGKIITYRNQEGSL